MSQGDDGADLGSDPFVEALERLTAAGLWPPIIGFNVEGTYDDEGETLDEWAVILHEEPVSPEDRARIDELMGQLGYKLTKIIRSAEKGVVSRVDEDGRVHGVSLHSQKPSSDA